MAQASVRLQIPFESLLDAIDNLPLEDKHRLWQLLDEEIRKVETELEKTLTIGDSVDSHQESQ